MKAATARGAAEERPRTPLAWPYRVTPAEYARAHREDFVRALMELVRFPTVGVDPARTPVMKTCARWLARRLRRCGMSKVGVVDTALHPIVYAEWNGAPDRPTLLLYGHYDVQPAEPERAWTSPPFEPVVRRGHLYGRGASDDKGQMLAQVLSLESHLSATGRLPVNVKCIFEGEEEMGSPSLPAFLAQNRAALGADMAVVSDASMLSAGHPAIVYGMRGQLHFDLHVEGPMHDLHCGVFGGAVRNPLQVLAEVIASLGDRSGRVAVRGFYDEVRAVSGAERAHLARVAAALPTTGDDEGSTGSFGEPGYTPYERTTIRPALTVNGIRGGYGGSGNMAVLPARASAKVTIRLVPDQKPNEIEALVRAHLARAMPRDVTWRMDTRVCAAPAVLDRRHPAMRVAARAYLAAFAEPPALVRMGGTIPVVPLLRSMLGIPTVVMGFGLPSDNIHAPDERMHLPTFARAIDACIALASSAATFQAGPGPLAP